jgi:GAF domain-containing protein/HAMP domain-containing protein
MNRQGLFGQAGTLVYQFSQRGRTLSSISVLALIALIIVGLGVSLQNAQRQLNDASSSAALTFNVFMSNIEGDLRATSDALPNSANPESLLNQTLIRQKTIFELVLVDPQGKVLTELHRGVKGDLIFDEQPWLATVKAGDIYIGPVDYHLNDLPFVDIAVPVTDKAGNFYATLVSKTDLTNLWNPVINLKVGKTGYVYITDQDGLLLAYSNQLLARQGANIHDLIGRGPQAIANSNINILKGVSGQWVITEAKPLGITSWYVLVEQPINEALLFFAMLSIVSVIALIFVGYVVFGMIRFILNRITVPLQLLQAGANELQQGQFKSRINIQTKDELGKLADTFNLMAAQLETWISTLEQRVTERTTELNDANKKNAERATRLRTIIEIGNTITSLENLNELLPKIAQYVSEALGVYHTGIFLIDPTGEYAILRASNSTGGLKMLERGHRLKVGQTGIVGYVTKSGKARVALDVGEDAEFFNNPDLPGTHSEVALPLQIGNQIIGALDVQSEQSAAFGEEDVDLLSIVANQVVIAIQNARRFQDAQDQLKEAQTLYQQFVRQEWKAVVSEGMHLGYRYSSASAAPLKELVTSPEIAEATRSGEITSIQEKSQSRLAIPIMLRGQTIGVLNLQVDEDRSWEQDEIDIAQAVAERVALAVENARLLENSQNTASKERAIGEISTKISAATNMDNILRTAIGELGNIIPDTDIFIQFVSGQELE